MVSNVNTERHCEVESLIIEVDEGIAVYRHLSANMCVVITVAKLDLER